VSPRATRPRSGARARPADPGTRGDRAPIARAPARLELDPTSASRAAIALGTCLALLAVARAALPFVPSTWGWSLDLIRYLSPATGWALWGVATLALIPPLARRFAPAFSRAGDAVARGPAALVIAAVAAAALVHALPDQVRFVGDFLLRQGAVEEAIRPGPLFPQSLPLDPVLHYTLPRAIVVAGWFDANGAARAMDAIEAALLALIGIAFTRTLGFRGAAALTSAAIVFFGGYLTLFTGYSKAFAELTVLTAAAGYFGIQAVRTGRGLLPFGVSLAIAFALHRSALALLVPGAVVWILWLRSYGAGGAWKRPAVIAAIALPLGVLIWVVPQVLHIVTSFDWNAHLKSSPAAATAAPGVHATDLLNLVIMHSPLALPAVVMAFLLGRDLARRRELLVLVALVVPFVALMAAIHPQNGIYRDWDVHAAGGVALSLFAAWIVGATLESAPRFAWLGLAASLTVATLSIGWLAHHVDIDRGLARVEAFVTRPPRRAEYDRAATWDFLGIRNFNLKRWDAAAHDLAQTAALTPSPRILMEWALASIRAGNYDDAERAYQALVKGSPHEVSGWRELAKIEYRRGNLDGARTALLEILKLTPGDAVATEMLSQIARMDSLRAARR
jgi:hypothetical protein